MGRCRLFVWWFFSLLLIAPVGAQTGFEEADRVFNQGDFEKAENLYQKLSEQAKAEQKALDLVRALEGVSAAQMTRGDRENSRANSAQASSLRRQFAPATGSAPSPELVQGGDFEQGLQPPWGTGHYESGNFNFGIWWNSKTCRSFAKTDSQIRYRGQSSLRITNLTPAGDHLFGTTSQRIRGIKPNTIYELSVWARGEEITPGAVQFVMDAGWHKRPLALPGGTYDWKLFKAQFNSGDLNFFDLRILTLNTGTVWLDQLSLRELTEDERPTEGVLAAEALYRKGRLLDALHAFRELPESPAVQMKTAEVLAALGQYGEAVTLYRSSGVQLPEVGLAIGEIYLKLGQPLEAVEHFLSVYKTNTQDQYARALAADLLGTAYLRAGDISKAISWQGEALAIMTHINDVHGRSLTLYHLALLHHQAGQIPEAKRRLEDSLPLARSTGDRTIESDILTLRAVIAGEAGNTSEALVDLEQAVALKRQVFDRYGLLHSLYWRGRFLEVSGRLEEAVASMEEATAILEEVKDASAAIAGSGETLSLSHSRIYEELIRLYLQLNKEEKALETLTRSRSAELNRIFQEKASNLKPQDQKLVRQAVVLRSEKAALESSLREQLSAPEEQQDKEQVEETREEQENRQREYRQFLSSLFQSHPELAGLISVHPKQLRLKQRGLKEGEAILEYLCGEKQLYVFLVTPQTLEVKIMEIARADLNDRVLKLQRAIRGQAAGSLPPEEVVRQSHELYQLLLKPVRSHLAGVETLGILPNGPLHYLPFQLLVSNPEGPSYLVDETACLNMCEESFLAPPSEVKSLRKLLLLGNPDGSLGNAEIEVEEIAEIFPESELYVRHQASKDKLYSGNPSYQGLHIATHGVFDHSDAARSYLTLAPGSSDHDSRLTVGEIWGMNMEGYEMVTLSACLTGWGEENPGDDLISLENAFLYAGARSVVASLWSVDDEATNLLMKSFYSELKAGKAPADALRTAQLKVKQKYPAPFFWAPFIVVGPG
ncbi:MAG: CHAT domain-containing protein [Vulcanimicrobiota bacterium]